MQEISEGKYGIITYKIEKDYSSTIYRVTCATELIIRAKENFSKFLALNVPKYGKYEVENFVAKMLLISLITGNITELFNTCISFDDYPYNSYFYSKDEIKESILQYCEVLNIDKEKDIITLKYQGKNLYNS